MSTIKISQLDSVSTLTENDMIPVVNDGKTKKATIGKLNNIYATKQYVSNVTTGKIISKYITWGKGLDTTGEYPEEAKTIMSEVINTLSSILGSSKTPQIQITLDASSTYKCYLEPFSINNKYEDFYFNEYGGSFLSGDDYIHAEQYHIYPGQYQMRVQGSWNSGEFVATSVSRIKNIDYLSKSATAGTYTPTHDISPATKKYVDDSVANIDTSGSGDPYTYYMTKGITPSSSFYKGYRVTLTTAMKAELGEIFTDAYAKSKRRIRLCVLIDTTPVIFETGINSGVPNITSKPAELSFNAMVRTSKPYATDTTSDYLNDFNNMLLALTVDITWSSDNVATISSGEIRAVTDSQSIASVTYYNKYFLPRNNTQSFTPTGNYNPATKKYVDDAIAGIQTGGDCNINYVHDDVTTTTGYIFGSTGLTITDNVKTQIEDIFNGNTFDKPIYLTFLNQGVTTTASFIFRPKYKYTTQLTAYQYDSFEYNNAAAQTDNKGMYVLTLTIQGSWSNNVFTCSSVKITNSMDAYYARKDKVLYKNNTTAFEPTADYHPATKKYVDDSIANIDVGGGDSNNGLYILNLPNTLINGSKFSVKNADDKQSIIDFMEFCNNNDIQQPSIKIRTDVTSNDYTMLTAIMHAQGRINSGNIWFYGWQPFGVNEYKYMSLHIYGTWADNVFTFGYADYTEQSSKKILLRDNTAEYTPTADYNPATKKYVDDVIKTAITDALGGEY